MKRFKTNEEAIKTIALPGKDFIHL